MLGYPCCSNEDGIDFLSYIFPSARSPQKSGGKNTFLGIFLPFCPGYFCRRMMHKGISLHIGLSKLSTAHYRSAGLLNSPANDAKAMAAIAEKEGYAQRCLLVDEKATQAAFIEELERCAGLLAAGDTFLLSFCGHGGTAKDTNYDEADGQDETWCFYDGPLPDDEIGKRWKLFREGVRIVVVSSSCHSRTGLKPWAGNTLPLLGKRKRPPVQRKVVTTYPPDPTIKAGIIHLSACEDDQQARDGKEFSVFTALLLKHWDKGRFTGTYEDLARAISLESGYLQTAGIALLGHNCRELLESQPFKLLTHKT